MGNDEVLAGRTVHVLSVMPSASDSARFTRLLAWVDAKSCVALRVDFYEGQTVRKRLSVDAKSLRRDGGYWYAPQLQKLGRTSCRARVCPYVYISVVAVYLKKKKKTN